MAELDPSEMRQRPNGPDLRTRSLAGVSWGLVDNVGQQILSLVFFVVLGRLLTPALFGVVSTALVFVFLMRGTILNAVSTALVTMRQPRDVDYDTGFWMLVVIGLISCGFLNLIAGPLAQLYKIDEFDDVLRAVSVIIFFNSVGFAHYGWARKNFRFRALAIRNIMGVVAGGAAGVALAVAGYGIAALVANQLVAAIVSLTLLWISVPWRPRFRFDRTTARTLWATALPLGATQGLQALVQNFDTALVTLLLGPFGGGLYAGAKRIVLSIQLALWQPISQTTLPVFTEVIDDRARTERLLVLGSTLVFAITAPVMIGLASIAPGLMVFLFGEKWAPAAPILSILALGSLAVPLTGVLNQVIIARSGSAFILTLTVGQFLLVLSALAFVHEPSPVSVALCLTLPQLIVYVATAADVRRLRCLPLRAYLAGLAPPLLAAGLMTLAVRLVPPLPGGLIVQLAVQVAVGGMVYAGTIYVVGRALFNEVLAIVTRFVPARFRRAAI